MSEAMIKFDWALPPIEGVTTKDGEQIPNIKATKYDVKHQRLFEIVIYDNLDGPIFWEDEEMEAVLAEDYSGDIRIEKLAATNAYEIDGYGCIPRILGVASVDDDISDRVFLWDRFTFMVAWYEVKEDGEELVVKWSGWRKAGKAVREELRALENKLFEGTKIPFGPDQRRAWLASGKDGRKS